MKILTEKIDASKLTVEPVEITPKVEEKGNYPNHLMSGKKIKAKR
jgi:hypothetical protein